MAKEDVVIARYSLVIKPTGEVASVISNITPEAFLKTAQENSPAWSDAELVAKSIGFVIERFEEMDKELDKYIGSL